MLLKYSTLPLTSDFSILTADNAVFISSISAFNLSDSARIVLLSALIDSSLFSSESSSSCFLCLIKRSSISETFSLLILDCNSVREMFMLLMLFPDISIDVRHSEMSMLISFPFISKAFI